MSASSPSEQKHARACPFATVADYRHFSFHHAIQFHPVECIVTIPVLLYRANDLLVAGVEAQTGSA